MIRAGLLLHGLRFTGASTRYRGAMDIGTLLHCVGQTSDLYSGNFLIKTAYERAKDVVRYDMRKTRLLAHGHGMP
ncbi:MAG: hypothetical protein E7467_01440 [Ruminococcaceae bacterium]|nr:hypothetical protein [Oscillospiraceae bacterium]